MTRASTIDLDPRTDLMIERVVDVPPELVYEAWTNPEELQHWFTPEPWKTVEATMDLRPGGVFRFVMQSPEGERFPHAFCYLEIVPNERLVWTSALGRDFRPGGALGDVPDFTAVVTLEKVGKGSTRYRALALHRDEASRARHEQMGFHEGWGTVLTQLVEWLKSKR